MTAVIHQAYFLPWLGYFNKLAYADKFIILDDVQYRIRYFHNRTNIKGINGKRQWATLPVGKGLYKAPANSVNVISMYEVRKVFSKIHHCYARTKYYKKYWPLLNQTILDGYPNLLEININCIKALLNILNFNPIDISRSSELETSKDTTQRLIEICHAVNAKSLIMGPESCLCHNLVKINKNGIKTIKHEFLANHPKYEQIHGKFVSRLSTIDALFNTGAKHTAMMIKSD